MVDAYGDIERGLLRQQRKADAVDARERVAAVARRQDDRGAIEVARAGCVVVEVPGLDLTEIVQQNDIAAAHQPIDAGLGDGRLLLVVYLEPVVRCVGSCRAVVGVSKGLLAAAAGADAAPLVVNVERGPGLVELSTAIPAAAVAAPVVFVALDPCSATGQRRAHQQGSAARAAYSVANDVCIHEGFRFSLRRAVGNSGVQQRFELVDHPALSVIDGGDVELDDVIPLGLAGDLAADAQWGERCGVVGLDLLLAGGQSRYVGARLRHGLPGGAGACLQGIERGEAVDDLWSVPGAVLAHGAPAHHRRGDDGDDEDPKKQKDTGVGHGNQSSIAAWSTAISGRVSDSGGTLRAVIRSVSGALMVVDPVKP